MKRGGRKGERLQGAAEFALRGLAQVLEAFARVVVDGAERRAGGRAAGSTSWENASLGQPAALLTLAAPPLHVIIFIRCRIRAYWQCVFLAIHHLRALRSCRRYYAPIF